VNRLQSVERGFLFDSVDLGLDVGTETDLLHEVSIRFLIADLIHSETALRDHLLEGNTAFGVLAEVLARGGNGVTVFLRYFIIFIVDHDFEQMNDSGDLTGAELFEQLMRLLFGCKSVNGHNGLRFCWRPHAALRRFNFQAYRMRQL
jgi:hypothetical protein